MWRRRRLKNPRSQKPKNAIKVITPTEPEKPTSRQFAKTLGLKWSAASLKNTNLGGSKIRIYKRKYDETQTDEYGNVIKNTHWV